MQKLQINYLLIVLTIALATVKLSAQENPCECCLHSSLKFDVKYEEFFLPNLIESKKIIETIAFTQSHSNEEKSPSDEYTEMRFKFDKKGYVSQKFEYNLGKLNNLYDFKRNLKGKVIKQTFYYLDSLGVKSDFFPPETIDYSYDSNGNLIKSKNRGLDEKVLPDSKTNHVKYRYDSFNRILNIFMFQYSSSGNSSSISSDYNYDVKNYTGTYESTYNNKPFSSGSLTYNKEWQKLTENGAFEEIYKYDEAGRLIEFKSTAGENAASECPDGGNFTDKYFYDRSGLLESISHSYGNHHCKIRFEYNK